MLRCVGFGLCHWPKYLQLNKTNRSELNVSKRLSTVNRTGSNYCASTGKFWFIITKLHLQGILICKWNKQHVYCWTGPASFIWESPDGDCKYVETDRDTVWAKLGFPDRRNINVTTSDEPMDISYSLEELQVINHYVSKNLPIRVGIWFSNHD